MTLPNPRRSLHQCGETMTESRLRHTGIGVVGDMLLETHFCHFYDSKQDLLDTLVPYFKAGLDDKEFCVWVIADPLTKDEAWNALRLAVRDLDRHLADQSIEVFADEEWYLKNNTFDLQRATSAWNEKLAQALARGYTGMRFSGDTCWLQKKDWQDFCAYENHLNASISDQAITVWCTYPLAKSGAAEILDVARTHQFCLTRRSGNWEVIETGENKLAKQKISKLNEELERRVDELFIQFTYLLFGQLDLPCLDNFPVPTSSGQTKLMRTRHVQNLSSSALGKRISAPDSYCLIADRRIEVVFVGTKVLPIFLLQPASIAGKSHACVATSQCLCKLFVPGAGCPLEVKCIVLEIPFLISEHLYALIGEVPVKVSYG